VHRTGRDKALFCGLLRPLAQNDAEIPIESNDVDKVEILLKNLVFQLRLQRRRGVWPLVINILGFLVAFIASTVSAFADLGDNTAAYSLALGPLLSCFQP
jgi:hypothetical protein